MKLVAVFALMLSSAFAGVSDFTVTFYQPARIAGAQLKPGAYRVKVDGDKIIIRDGKKTIEAAVKSEQVSDKFKSTSVRYLTGDGQLTVDEIRIGGTNTKLVLN
ncbi:MAG: hypothetical protein ACK5XD_00205 [Acidobacteriota bacterium]